MRLRNTVIGLTAVLLLGTAALLTAQAPATPDNTQAPTTAPAARGARGGRGGARGPARGPDFPQQTRQLASADVIARGKAVFAVNCTACHGTDLRGGDMGGPNLLRSQLALSDQHGELIASVVHGARQDKGMPAFNLSNDDITAIAEYIHSMLAQVGRQGRPPGAEDIPVLQVIIGNSVAGKTYFDGHCASCHSVTGDLAGIGAKYTDGRELQNQWVGGGSAGGRGGSAAPAANLGAKPTTVTVTLANGQKIEGNLLQENEFIVTLVQQDGTRRSIARGPEVKSVEVHSPDDAHKKLVLTLADKDMHDVTAYLATVK